MANYANLEAAIQAAIYENNTNDITGAALQSVLLQMVSSMGKSGMLCNGVADSSTTPPVNPDSNIFYIAPTGTYPNFGGLVVADGEWAIFIYNGSWQKQSVPVVTADAVPTTGSTNPVQSGGVADALEQKADIDGYYSTLTAGSAENLIGRGTVPAEYTRRTSGGSADIGSGAAAIEKIHGNTIAWNQLAEAVTTTTSSYDVTCTPTGGGQVHINGTATGITALRLTNYVSIINGHKYYLTCPSSAIGGTIRTDNWYISFHYAADQRGGIVTCTGDETTYLFLRLDNGNSIDAYFYPQIFDLTLMFGAGNEPSTAAEFEALFPLNYYAYNAGSLLSLTGTGIETNGFNQWDEEWEVGSIDTTTGQNTIAGSVIRSVNYIPVFGNTQYYYKSSASATMYYYDAEKNYLGYNFVSGLFTTFANALYVRFVAFAAYGTVYNHDICLNLSWSGYRNGEYEAYWDSTLALPITTVTSGGSAVFADGMKSAGTVYDELTGTKAVKRMGIVDLGTLNWTYDSGQRFAVQKPDAAHSPTGSPCMCARYVGYTGVWSDFSDKQVIVGHNTYSGSSYIVIKDSAYTDAAVFKTAMNGVYLVYELATPVEYTLDSEVNLNYRVDNLGTEAEVPQNTATPTTAPIVYDVRYAMNAVDTLRNLPTNYISKDSLKNLLDAFVSAGVISAYTMTYNAGTEQYIFTITA